MSDEGTPAGFLVTLEGPEGSGKSTQVERLAGALRGVGFPVTVTREPGGTPLGEAIRRLLLMPDARVMQPWTEALLFTADRAEHVRQVIRPRLAAGDVVLCDRYADSTIAYQGYGRRLDRELLERLQRAATGDLVPDLSLLLDLPVEAGLSRIPRQAADRLDRETVAFHASVRDGYLELAAREPARWRVVDAASDSGEVARQVFSHVAQALKDAGRRPMQRRSA